MLVLTSTNPQQFPHGNNFHQDTPEAFGPPCSLPIPCPPESLAKFGDNGGLPIAAESDERT